MIGPWHTLSWAEKQVYIKKLSELYSQGLSSNEICKKLDCNHTFYARCARKAYLAPQENLENGLSKKGLEDLKLWRKLNAYQGPKQAHNFDG